MPPLYLDYQSTTPCAQAVQEAMAPYFGAEKFGNPHALAHAHGRAAAEAFKDAKTRIAALVGATPEMLTLTSGATEANNIALFGTAQAAKDAGNPRNEIVISALEHDSVRHTAVALASDGFIIKIAPANQGGFITPAAVENLLTDKTLLVSVMAANHEIGTVQPIAAIAQTAQAAGAMFHTDAAQAAGKIKIDMAGMGIDILSFCSHKIYGPGGAGALCVRQKPPVDISPVFFGGRQQPLRAGTVALALAVGFAKACDIALEEMEEETARLSELSVLFLTALERTGAKFFVNGASHPRIAGTFNVRFEGVFAEDVLLDVAETLCLSTGAACASLDGKPSAVLAAIGLTDEAIAQSLRLSFGRMTMQDDVLFAADALAAAVKRLRAGA